MATRLEKAPLFPFLLGLYPVLALLAHNVDEIELVFAIRPIILTLLLVIFLFWIGRLILKDKYRAAVLVTIFVLLFFSYGHLYFYLRNHPVLDINLARIRYLVPFYSLVFILALVWVLRSKSDFQKLAYPINITAIAALLLPLVQIGIYVVQVNLASEVDLSASPEFDSIQVSPEGTRPDIYYIVLDGYSRQDMLKQAFDYDNSDFIDALIGKGFFVARCSQANYSWTSPSIASTFKMGYLDEGTGETRVLVRLNERRDLIIHGPVRELLEGLGYTTVAFETGYKWQHWYDADIYLTPEGGGWLGLGLYWNEFELMLFDTSALRLLSDANFIKDTYANHRQRILNALDSLETIPTDIPGPKFIYAHVIAPHDPYVFGPDGEWLDTVPENQIIGYRNQVNYINTRIIEIVNILIEKSPTLPVIIIQGDHGAPINWEGYGLPRENKLAILNVYYFPGVDDENLLYDTITPVNTFRLVFDLYFNGELGLLEDRSIFGKESPLIELPCEEH
jgi:hypothetical protein